MSRNFAADLIRVRWRYQKAKSLLRKAAWREKSSFKELRLGFYEKFWRDSARNIGAEIEPLGYGYRRIWKQGRWALVNEGGVRMDCYLVLDMVRNKPLIHNLLEFNRCPVPRFAEYDINNLDVAWQFLQQLQRAAVVKPASGTGGGQGITKKVCDRKVLEKASIHAATFDWSLLIEEEVQGHSYRLLFLDGKLIDAVRRDPPTVTGDGRRSIRGLMNDETEARLLDAPRYRALSPLTVDSECLLQLHSQGLNPEHVPAAGRQIVVKTVINQNSRAENHRVLRDVHPSWEELGSSLVASLGIRFAGLDVIARDIGVSTEEGGVINEINTPPGIHHHLLVAESETNPPIGEMILEAMLADSGVTEPGKLY